MLVYFVITQSWCAFLVARGEDVAIFYRLRLIIPVFAVLMSVRAQVTEGLSLNFSTIVIPLSFYQSFELWYCSLFTFFKQKVDVVGCN